jgi:tellurite methyltransferase
MGQQSGPEGDRIRRFDQWYQGEEHVFGVEPSAGILEALPFLVPGRVLDLGSGDGRNALFLAGKGFEVTAVDVAPTAIANLTRYAARAGLEGMLRGVVADIETFAIDGPYESIISTFTLHFLPRDAYVPTLRRIMESTCEGGVNVIEDFTQDGPMYRPDLRGYMPESGELRRLYEVQGWSILYYGERITTSRATDEHGDHYQQGTATVVARRG